jgi:hypothetical protein
MHFQRGRDFFGGRHVGREEVQVNCAGLIERDVEFTQPYDQGFVPDAMAL